MYNTIVAQNTDSGGSADDVAGTLDPAARKPVRHRRLRRADRQRQPDQCCKPGTRHLVKQWRGDPDHPASDARAAPPSARGSSSLPGTPERRPAGAVRGVGDVSPVDGHRHRGLRGQLVLPGHDALPTRWFPARFEPPSPGPIPTPARRRSTSSSIPRECSASAQTITLTLGTLA